MNKTEKIQLQLLVAFGVFMISFLMVVYLFVKNCYLDQHKDQNKILENEKMQSLNTFAFIISDTQFEVWYRYMKVEMDI